jgi:CubicO group peptidase (beta-lactamase class C family)
MYANVNVLLLDEVVTRTSGMLADAFRREVLYQPLGLRSTCARPHDGIVSDGLAEPYVSDGSGGWQRATDLLGIAADQLTTTLADLTRWLLALRHGSIGNVQVTRAMVERVRLTDGRPVHYGLGLAVRRYRGATVLCHTGSQPGYKAHIAYIPALDFGLVVLSNREDTRPAALAAAIMEDAIGNEFAATHPAERARARLSAAGFTAAQESALAGDYVDLQSGEWISISIEDGIVRGETLGDPFFVYPEAGGVFRDGDDYRATVPVELRLEFGSEPGGVRGRLNLGGQDITLLKHRRPRYEASRLRGFTGRYESVEMDSRHSIWLEDDRLVIAYGLGLDRGRTFPMEPIAPDTFLVKPGGPGIAYRHVFRFERDPTDTVMAAVVTMERLKRVRLTRTDQAGAP